jgi:hypothetical protein
MGFLNPRPDDGHPPYCSSVTCSIHSTALPSSISAIAMWVIAVVGDAPCQCRSPGAEPHDVAGANLLDRSAVALHASATRRDDQRLPERMCVPRRAAPGLERHGRSADAARSTVAETASQFAPHPVNQSAGPLADGCDPLLEISMVFLQLLVYGVRTSATSPYQYAAVTPPSIRKSLPVLKPPSGPMQQRADGTDFVRRPCPFGHRAFDHATVPGTTRSGEFVLGQRGHDDPRADRIDSRAPRFPQCTASAMTRSRISALRELIRVQRVLHLIELQEAGAFSSSSVGVIANALFWSR